jgi:hypothetical protein
MVRVTTWGLSTEDRNRAKLVADACALASSSGAIAGSALGHAQVSAMLILLMDDVQFSPSNVSLGSARRVDEKSDKNGVVASVRPAR